MAKNKIYIDEKAIEKRIRADAKRWETEASIKEKIKKSIAEEKDKAERAHNKNRSDIVNKKPTSEEDRKQRMRDRIAQRSNSIAAVRAATFGDDFNASLASTNNQTTSQHRIVRKKLSKLNAAAKKHNASINSIKTSEAAVVLPRRTDNVDTMRTILNQYSYNKVILNDASILRINDELKLNIDEYKDWIYTGSYQIRANNELISAAALKERFARSAGIYADEVGILVDEGEFDKVVSLYHGTPYQNLSTILNNTLKPGNDYCLFGSGIYTTPDIAKAWGYSDGHRGDTSTSVKYILECKVRLGPVYDPSDSVKNYFRTSLTDYRSSHYLNYYSFESFAQTLLDMIISMGYMSVYGKFKYREYCSYLSEQIEIVMAHEFVHKDAPQKDKDNLK